MAQSKKSTPVEAEVQAQSTEIVTQDNQIVNVENLIAQAITQKLPVETMERFFTLAKEMQAIKAKTMFNEAMAKFQSECPTIVKTKEVHTKTGQLAYKYAPIESIVEQVKQALTNNGFSYSTQQEMLENSVKVTVKVTHIVGHSEITDMTVPLGTQTQMMSNSQVVAAASTFAKRYAFCNAFGILTGDEDTDARPLEDMNSTDIGQPQTKSFPPSDKQMELIKSQMREKNITEADLITDGLPPLKDLTGGKEGTASEVIGYLFEHGRPNGFNKVTEEDKVVFLFIQDLEKCQTVPEYDQVCSDIRIAKDNGKLIGIDYDKVLKVAKITAKRIQDRLPPLETKPKTEAAQAMLRGIAKAKERIG